MGAKYKIYWYYANELYLKKKYHFNNMLSDKKDKYTAYFHDLGKIKKIN